MDIKGRLEKRVSKKSGNEYVVLMLKFPNGYEKQVFLEQAELYMLDTKDINK